ncbi:MAG: GyrI-like domain-containing protein [Saprospiraceae bacterium]
MKNYYFENLNRVLQYIDQHLGEDLHLTLLARISHFSPFHFQRIFKALVTENPYEYILRKRLEKAVFLLKHQPSTTVTKIAYDCGFPSPENFSRQFKQRFGFTAWHFKRDKTLQKSKIYQEEEEGSFYLAYEKSRAMPQSAFEVTVREEVAVPIAFIRAIFGADGSGLLDSYHTLMAWAETVGINPKTARRFGMSIDDPEVTPSQKYRYDFAISREQLYEELGKMEQGVIPGGLYASLHCEGDIHKVAQAWDYLYKVWLPQSGYVPRHFPAIEEFLKGPEKIGWDRFDLKCLVPVEKM